MLASLESSQAIANASDIHITPTHRFSPSLFGVYPGPVLTRFTTKEVPDYMTEHLFPPVGSFGF